MICDIAKSPNLLYRILQQYYIKSWTNYFILLFSNMKICLIGPYHYFFNGVNFSFIRTSFYVLLSHIQNEIDEFKMTHHFTTTCRQSNTYLVHYGQDAMLCFFLYNIFAQAFVPEIFISLRVKHMFSKLWGLIYNKYKNNLKILVIIIQSMTLRNTLSICTVSYFAYILCLKSFF